MHARPVVQAQSKSYHVAKQQEDRELLCVWQLKSNYRDGNGRRPQPREWETTTTESGGFSKDKL